MEKLFKGRDVVAKASINPEGVAALEQLARGLLINANEILEACNRLETSIHGLSDHLGIYRDSIFALSTRNKNILRQNRESTVLLANALKKKAQDIQDMLSFSGAPSGIGITGLNTPSVQFASQSLNNPTKTIAGIVIDMVANGFTAFADFGSLDYRVAEVFCATIAETKQMFPDLDLRYVGSAQARNDAVSRQICNMYLQGLRASNPGASDADLLPHAKQLVDNDMMQFAFDDSMIAQSIVMDSSSPYANFSGITINEYFGHDYDFFCRKKQEDVDAGWKPYNCGTPKATVDHELGHHIAALVGASNDPDIRDMYNNFVKLDTSQRAQILSGYAATSIDEFLAESWSEYRNNPNCRDCARVVATKMIDLYGTAVPQHKLIRR